MRLLAIVLLANAAISFPVGLALATVDTTYTRPHWMIFGRQVSIDTYGVDWFTPDDLGTAHTALYVWPPRIHTSYISKEHAKLLFDDRTWHGDQKFDPEFRKANELVYEADRAKDWTWPRWR